MRSILHSVKRKPQSKGPPLPGPLLPRREERERDALTRIVHTMFDSKCWHLCEYSMRVRKSRAGALHIGFFIRNNVLHPCEDGDSQVVEPNWGIGAAFSSRDIIQL